MLHKNMKYDINFLLLFTIRFDRVSPLLHSLYIIYNQKWLEFESECQPKILKNNLS